MVSPSNQGPPIPRTLYPRTPYPVPRTLYPRTPYPVPCTPVPRTPSTHPAHPELVEGPLPLTEQPRRIVRIEEFRLLNRRYD